MRDSNGSSGGYTLAKFGIDGTIKWNIFHLQGVDVNMSTTNVFRMPKLKVSPNEEYVAFRARLMNPADSNINRESITIYNTDGTFMNQIYYSFNTSDSGDASRPVYSKFEFSPSSKYIAFVSAYDRISADGNNNNYL